MIALAGCGSDGGGDADRPLRIAMGSPGEAQIAVWEETAELFEERTGVPVELNIQDDDLYETIGLNNLLSGGEPPDIYFEWTGARLSARYDEGHAADLSDAVSDGPLAGLFDEGDFKGMEIDGQVVMVPGVADVTNVLWYNTEIFADLGLTPPTTWDELLATCQALDAEGIVPIASGNADLWAAGNWLAHQSSRVVGEDAYDAALAREATFDTSEWVDALGYVDDLRENGCVNESVNAINDNEGAQLFFQGAAAMHPIGSWLVSWAVEAAPDLSFDYVNLPSIPEGSGAQDSVIGVATGYVVNADSDMIDEAADFLALFNSEEIVAKLVEAGSLPMARAADSAEGIDERLLRLAALIQDADAIVAPPDTGYELQVADALYAALADVLGGQKSPEEALADAEAKLE
jgi:raffinose/stachyose/melibiose transport system substrate-binding protein